MDIKAAGLCAKQLIWPVMPHELFATKDPKVAPAFAVEPILFHIYVLEPLLIHNDMFDADRPPASAAGEFRRSWQKLGLNRAGYSWVMNLLDIRGGDQAREWYYDWYMSQLDER